MDENRYSITSDYENVDWEKVMPILMAYAHKLLSHQNIRVSELADMAYDFTMNSILTYLDKKDKFDPSRNPDLIWYLKYNLLRRIISNYAKSGDNTIISQKQIDDPDTLHRLIDEFPIDETIDVEAIVTNVKKEIENDVVMSIIFEARYTENMKRSEICQEFSIDTSTYDNAMKRLRKIVEKHLN